MISGDTDATEMTEYHMVSLWQVLESFSGHYRSSMFRHWSSEWRTAINVAF
jgi:hypothetical protein